MVDFLNIFLSVTQQSRFERRHYEHGGFNRTRIIMILLCLADFM